MGVPVPALLFVSDEPEFIELLPEVLFCVFECRPVFFALPITSIYGCDRAGSRLLML